MKLLQSMLRREVERLASPIYLEYRQKLQQAVENEPVSELITAVQAVASELNHTASPALRGLGRTLEIHAQKAIQLYNVDHSHDIAQSWSKRTYDKLLADVKRSHDFVLEQSGYSFELSAKSGTRTRTCFVRLRQPFVEVRYAGLLKQYGSDQEYELNRVIASAITDMRNEARTSTYKTSTSPHWTEKAYAKVIGVVGNCKWSTIDSGASEFRFDNPEKKMCVVKIVDGKMYVNYEGKIDWYTDEKSFLDGMATILDQMEPWAEKHFGLMLTQVRLLNFDIAEGHGVFEFQREGGGKAIVRLTGDKVSLEYDGAVGIYNDSKQLAQALAEVVVKMLVRKGFQEAEQEAQTDTLSKNEARMVTQAAYDAVKQSLSEFPGVKIVEEKGGFSFTVEGPENVKFPQCTVHLVKEDLIQLTGYGIIERYRPDEAQALAKTVSTFLHRLVSDAEKVGRKEGWSNFIFKKVSKHLNTLPIAGNMVRTSTPEYITIELKNQEHGFRLQLDGINLVVIHDSDIRGFNEQMEAQLFNHLAQVIKDFRTHGKAY